MTRNEAAQKAADHAVRHQVTTVVLRTPAGLFAWNTMGRWTYMPAAPGEVVAWYHYDHDNDVVREQVKITL